MNLSLFISNRNYGTTLLQKPGLLNYHQR
jgi:hypothetical protein